MTNLEQAKIRYYSNPKTCEYCHEIIELRPNERPSVVRKRRFCNLSCANRFNNPPQSTSKKICIVCKVEKPIEQFYINRSRPNGRQNKCKICQHLWQKDWLRRNPDKRLAKRSYNQRRREEIYDYVNNLKTKPCTDCGNEYNPWQMQFDHIDTKIGNISDMVVNNTLRAIKEELEKCELVCANCHANRTYYRLKPNT